MMRTTVEADLVTIAMEQTTPGTPRTKPTRRMERSRTPVQTLPTTVEEEAMTGETVQARLRRQIAETALQLAEEQARARLRLARTRPPRPLSPPPTLDLLPSVELAGKIDAIKKELMLARVAQAIGAKWQTNVVKSTMAEGGDAGEAPVGGSADGAAAAGQTAAAQTAATGDLAVQLRAGESLSPAVLMTPQGPTSTEGTSQCEAMKPRLPPMELPSPQGPSTPEEAPLSQPPAEQMAPLLPPTELRLPQDPPTPEESPQSQPPAEEIAPGSPPMDLISEPDWSA